ncbi:MAG: hypothetical protein FWF41_08840 [Betaproteobacteria bacterium]|nr:hypothetical protein [Betaproteobacteria bacterium]
MKIKNMLLSTMVFSIMAAPLSVPALAEEKLSPSVELVTRLYREFAWETVIDEPLNSAPGFADQPAPVLAKYLDKELVSLLIADRLCASKGEVCNLDFLPLWEAQDIGATDLKIQATVDPKIVVVHFRYGNKQTELRFKMSQTADGLRIHDIQYKKGPSLRQILERKP